MALNHYPQEEHRQWFLARQYCCSKQEVLCSEVASDAGRCMLMMGRSGDLRGITRPHWVAMYGLLGNTRMTPYAQKRREAGWTVWADMALDGLFLLRRLTRTTCASEPTQQTASRCASYAAHARVRRRSRTRDREAPCPHLAPPSLRESGSRSSVASVVFGIRGGGRREVAYFFFSSWRWGFDP